MNYFRYFITDNQHVFSKFIENLEDFSDNAQIKRRFVNPQTQLFTRNSHVADIIHFINAEFDIILILEKLDESLAVMMVKFDLDLDDVVTIKNNQFKPADKISKLALPNRVKDKILRINDNDLDLTLTLVCLKVIMYMFLYTPVLIFKLKSFIEMNKFIDTLLRSLSTRSRSSVAASSFLEDAAT